MARSGVQFNEAAIRALRREVAAKIERADGEFREIWSGKPVDQIEPQVASAFARIGVQLQPGQIRDYARAVADAAPFRWVLS